MNLGHSFQGSVVVQTDNSPVNIGSTAPFWGEGPNVEGFRPGDSAQAVSPEQMARQLEAAGMHPAEVPQFLASAEAWAESRG